MYKIVKFSLIASLFFTVFTISNISKNKINNNIFLKNNEKIEKKDYVLSFFERIAFNPFFIGIIIFIIIIVIWCNFYDFILFLIKSLKERNNNDAIVILGQN